MDLKSMTASLLFERKFREEMFFESLLNGQMTKEQFIKTQAQFYHAVINFVLPLAFVAGNVPSYEDRVNIIRNLWEEHGEGDMTATHGATFKRFLSRLIKSEFKLDQPGTAVSSFNSILNETSKNHSYLKSLAMLGMIELMFSEISHFIGTAVIERGWMTSDELVHYKLHKELDVIHAQDFFEIIEKHADLHIDEVEEGLKLGRDVFLDLYHGLHCEANV